MEISINVGSDSDNSYTDNIKLILEKYNGLVFLKIDDGREREISVDAKELELAIETLNKIGND